MSRYDSDGLSRPSRSVWGYIFLALGVFVVFVLLIGACGSVTSFKGVDAGDVCVVKEGGPLDGRDVKEVRQPASSPAFIGPFNQQLCFPANERSYTLSSTASESDSKTVDTFKTPTKDAVEVYIEGQARFTLSTDAKAVEDFYRSYGTRSYDGEKPYDGGDGWDSFLAQVFRPVLQNSLREVIGKYSCVELNNTCQYVQNTEAITEGKVQEVNSSQNLTAVQTELAETLASNLEETLGGKYFTNVRFNLVRVSFEDSVEAAVTEAQTKRTEVANTRLEAQRKKEEAAGQVLAAREEAKAIQIKQQAYKDSPTKAEIDKIVALCGETGCTSLQVLGGEVSKLVR